MSSPEPPARAPGAGRLLAAGSGLLLAAAYPHADVGALAFVALVPLLVALRGCAVREGALRGFLCGAVFFSVLLYWIVTVTVTYGHLAWPVGVACLLLLVAYLAGYLALFAGGVAGLWRRAGPMAALLLAPVVWVACEILRARAITGFPWGLLGYSQYRNRWLLQAAALGGVYLVSFLVLSANAAVALLVLSPRGRPRIVCALALLGVVAAAHGAGALRLRGGGSVAGPQVEVAAVQASVEQDRKWDTAAVAAILGDLERLTRDAAASGARLIVWPESSSPLPVRFPGREAPSRSPRVVPNTPYLERLDVLARETGATLILGSVDYRVAGDRVEALNSAVVVRPDGAPGASYAKIHLVPFGEYVPLERLLFFVNPMVEGAIAGFAPGAVQEALPTPAGRAAVSICYEAIFPELVRTLGRDADFLINITNDAWFGRTAAPRQHLGMAVVRTVETGRDLLRAANTGISAIVDRTGRIRARTALLERTVLRGRLQVASGRTPYARVGDVFAWGCAILTALLTAAWRRPGIEPGS